MKQQEKSKEQENSEEIRFGQEPVLSNDTKLDDIESNPELAALAAHLKKTAPSVVVDPVFREELRYNLLDLLAKHTGSEAAKTIPENASQETREQGNAEAVNNGQKSAVSKDLRPKNTRSKAILTPHCKVAALLATADPVFRSIFRKKLIGSPALHHRPIAERALDATKRILERV
jgi:hypothetical protein